MQPALGEGAHQLEQLVALMALLPTRVIFLKEAGFQAFGKVRIELRFGLAMMAATYRDRLATAPDAAPLLDAIDRLGAAAEAIDRNPNELLLLQALVAGLPPL